MALDDEKIEEVEALRASAATTRRATVPALEELLYKPIPVLDHGFIRVIDYMGDDAAIVQAARVSYGRGTKQVSNDRGLINYLMRHRHTSPFEMCEIKLHVKLPIFVARQWIRHRMANVNEYSARYSVLDREFYVPDQEFVRLQKAQRQTAPAQTSLFGDVGAEGPKHTAAQSATNKQGRDELLERDAALQTLREIGRVSSGAFTAYEKLLGDEERPGLARELARVVLPLNTYTQWYWKIDLHNLLHFLQLRADAHAQYEIRAYADELMRIVDGWVPLTTRAFRKYRVGGAQLSADALEAVRRRLRGESAQDSGLSAGEWRELVTLIPELAQDSGHE
jgi:thymidylate synthase (FAD)